MAQPLQNAIAESEAFEESEVLTPEELDRFGLTPEEAEDFEGLTSEEIASELSDRPAENPSVRRCICAWKRTFERERREHASDEQAKDEAKSAFLRHMPPLDSFENVRDFIACVTFAEVAGKILHYEAENFLNSAKVALAAVRHERKPQQSEPTRRGRPPKLHAEENAK